MQWGLCSLANASVKHLVCVCAWVALLCAWEYAMGLINTVKVYEHSLTVVVKIVLFVNNVCWALLWAMFLERVM